MILIAIGLTLVILTAFVIVTIQHMRHGHDDELSGHWLTLLVICLIVLAIFNGAPV